MKMRWFALVLLLSCEAWGATLYCSPSGGGSGADFNNLCTLPDTTGFTRGNVYIIVDGSYGSKTLSTIESGTSTIEIRKASAANSAVAGYVSTLHDGEATFGDITVDTQYWIINGMTRTETTRLEAPAGYGIRASTITADSGNGNDASNSQFSYMDVGGTWSTETTPTCANTDGHALRLVYNQNNITFTRMAFHNRGSANAALCMCHGSSDITFDHTDWYMGWGKAGIASPNVEANRWTVRYSRFWNATRSEGTVCGGSGAGITTEAGVYANDLNPDGMKFYGNIFYGTASGGRNAVLDFGGSGFSNSVATNHLAYNNTFVGFPESPVLAHVYFYGGSGNESKNNLFWDITGTATHVANTVSNNQTEVSDPFVDSANLDFRLAASLGGGADLGAPYNTDPAGTTRTNWDVGAYEFAGAGPDPPTNFRIIGTLAGLFLLGGMIYGAITRTAYRVGGIRAAREGMAGTET